MPQSKILLDTNSYLRLARSIHPLLFQVFGEKNYCLYVLKALEDEVRRSHRLTSKFVWFDDQEFQQNRGKRLQMSKAEKRPYEITVDALWNYVTEDFPGPSKVDCQILAVASVIGIPTVTDDRDMRGLAKEFDIPTLSTLELLAMMLEADHVTKAKVIEICSYWAYDGDKPANFAKEYRRLFKEAPPG